MKSKKGQGLSYAIFIASVVIFYGFMFYVLGSLNYEVATDTWGFEDFAVINIISALNIPIVDIILLGLTTALVVITILIIRGV